MLHEKEEVKTNPVVDAVRRKDELVEQVKQRGFGLVQVNESTMGCFLSHGGLKHLLDQGGTIHLEKGEVGYLVWADGEAQDGTKLDGTDLLIANYRANGHGVLLLPEEELGDLLEDKRIRNEVINGARFSLSGIGDEVNYWAELVSGSMDSEAVQYMRLYTLVHYCATPGAVRCRWPGFEEMVDPDFRSTYIEKAEEIWNRFEKGTRNELKAYEPVNLNQVYWQEA